MASLILGHLHSIVSRILYEKLCSILTMGNLSLPSWLTMRRNRERLADMLEVKIKENQSIFLNRTFMISIKDLIKNLIFLLLLLWNNIFILGWILFFSHMCRNWQIPMLSPTWPRRKEFSLSISKFQMPRRIIPWNLCANGI